MGDVFKALASEPRRRILNHLTGGPMTVGEIAEKFEMATPSISKHLSVLKEAGLVHEQRRAEHHPQRLRPQRTESTEAGGLLQNRHLVFQ